MSLLEVIVSAFDQCYYPTEMDIVPFGDRWIGPTNTPFERMKETLIAFYLPQSMDGRSVKVYCTAAPARFWSLEVTKKGDKPAYWIRTGTQPAQAVHWLAKEISEGGLDVEGLQSHS